MHGRRVARLSNELVKSEASKVRKFDDWSIGDKSDETDVITKSRVWWYSCMEKETCWIRSNERRGERKRSASVERKCGAQVDLRGFSVEVYIT